MSTISVETISADKYHLADPILSIVIPTRNRVECAISCIRAALDATTTAQVVVVDSGDNDILREQIELLNIHQQARVCYVKNPTTFNVVENFEDALKHCTGRFVIYIGDDDLVGPYIENVCEWADNYDVHCVVAYGSRFGAAYYWPGVVSKYFGDAYSAKLFIWSSSSKYSSVNVHLELEKCKNHLGFGLGLMPRIYHGLVSRAILLEVKRRFGAVFGGVSPDIYSSALISHVASKVIHLDYPFCVPGASPKSEAGSGAARTDRITFEDSPYLRRFTNLTWNSQIPRFFSPYTVWSFSMILALRATGSSLSNWNLSRLYARCLVYCWRYRRETMECVNHQMHHCGNILTLAALILALIVELGSFSFRVLKKIFAPRAGGWATRVPNIEDTMYAYKYLSSHLNAPKLGPI